MNKVFIFLLLICFCYSNSQTQIGEDIDGEASENSFGQSVSISSDGSILAIGGYNNSGNGIWSGHVRVYQNVDNDWVQIGQDIDGENANDQLGYSVSLNSNGSVVAIGASLSFLSYVKVYQNLDGDWVQIGTTIFGEDIGDNSGYSLSLSGSGNILAIGEPGHDSSNGFDSGQVRVYENQDDNWVQIGNSIIGEGVSDRFGHSLQFSNDGSILAVGAIQNFESGYVKVYENQSGDWVQLGSNIFGEAAGDNCGFSEGLNSSGTILALGSENANVNTGHVRVYEYESNVWEQIGSNIDAEATGDGFGYSLSLNNNGDVLAVGAQGNNGNGPGAGHVRVFLDKGGTWIQVGSDIDGEASGDLSGRSVCLSPDGFVLAIGAPYNDGVNGSASGHVRVYDLKEALSVNNHAINNNFKIYPNPVVNLLKIHLEEGQTLKQIELFDTSGQRVLVSKNTDVSLTGIESGVYVMKTYTNRGMSITKILVN
ncbi:T9SS type A sorting domain-containing protein [Winogradskyella psychrotolerans]|uniref:T9SS type A sorting domain-containing protein n=1 Tax=Winogradskyella psychrotolerans TaxID=1344585 RepID=UPI001C067472|nr:T9SS type A sorting domain-containing protein [Winogradskyella psychrotolerans]MBU2927068.1 T9SS type A sorting domain-containing protein [Winogradskyella psychrotolerans]